MYSTSSTDGVDCEVFVIAFCVTVFLGNARKRNSGFAPLTVTCCRNIYYWTNIVQQPSIENGLGHKEVVITINDNDIGKCRSLFTFFWSNC